MTAQLVLPASAPREEWLAARRAGLGGSDASTVLGLNPYESRYTLWLDKTGRGVEKPDNDAMEWGRRLEPVIREWFTGTVGIEVRRSGLLRSRVEPIMQFTPDGLCRCGGVLETKTTSWRTEDAKTWEDGQVPDHAELQSQHGMAVTGRDHAHCVVLIDGRRPLHQVVQRDEKLIAELTQVERTFWHEHVIADVAPEIDGSDATTAALKARYGIATDEIVSAGVEVGDLIDRREQAKVRAKAADDELAELDNQLRATFGAASGLAVLGLVRATYVQNGSFSAKRFAADHPDLADDYMLPAVAFDAEQLKTDAPELWSRYRARVLRIPKNPKPVREN